jgi:hypothetical protein
MRPPRHGGGPGAHHARATTTETSTRQDAQPDTESTPAASTVEGVRRHEVVRAYLNPIVERARAAGPLPELGSAEWTAASDTVKLASAFAALLAYMDAATFATLVQARDRRDAPGHALRQASHAISSAVDWTAASKRPTHAELVRRRAVVGVSR